MSESTHVSITAVTILSGKKKPFKLEVNGKSVSVPIDDAIFAHYKEQFCRQNLSAPQKNRLSTLKNLMRAAYVQGCADGKAKP
jgi:hypothetical protein